MTVKLKDLTFKPHINAFFGGETTRVLFDNGLGASIITGGCSYTSSGAPYELAVLDKEGELRYDTPITDDVVTHQTEEEIDALLVRIEALEWTEEGKEDKNN